MYPSFIGKTEKNFPYLEVIDQTWTRISLTPLDKLPSVHIMSYLSVGVLTPMAHMLLISQIWEVGPAGINVFMLHLNTLKLIHGSGLPRISTVS